MGFKDSRLEAKKCTVLKEGFRIRNIIDPEQERVQEREIERREKLISFLNCLKGEQIKKKHFLANF